MNLKRSDKTKERDFEILGQQIVGRHVYGETIVRERLVSKVCLCRFSVPSYPCDKDDIFFLV